MTQVGGEVATGTTRQRMTLPAPARLALVLALLYLFLIGVGLLESAIKALGPDVQEELFASVDNPLAGLFVGVLATVLAQSSSVTTSTIVGLVGGGLLGVGAAVPMIMGANIGTTVTNTLASLGHLRRPNEFKPAFAAATIHDFFNIMSVAILLPLELATGILRRTAELLTSSLFGSSGATFDSPIKEAVKAPAGVVEDLLTGAGLDGTFLGLSLLVVGLSAIFFALGFITKNMRTLVADRVERSINEVLGKGGGLPALVIGILITIAVQSSSITTSILIPLAASGVLSLASTYPVTLGANLGTTFTALLASLATDRPEALTIALVHTLFNIAGITLFYPLPAARRIPILLAERLADVASRNRQIVLIYALGLFIVVPALGVAILR